MVELTPEEERSLKELVEVYGRGDSVKGFINNRLYNELSQRGESDGEGGFTESVYLDGYEEQRQVYIGLLEKGMISGSRPHHPITSYGFGNLTSEGRCYFEMKEAARKKERSRIWSNRRFQIALSVGTLVLSAVISTAISLYLNQPSDHAPGYQQAQQVAQGNAQGARDDQDEEAAPV